MEELPSGWKAYQTGEGQTYYHHALLGTNRHRNHTLRAHNAEFCPAHCNTSRSQPYTRVAGITQWDKPSVSAAPSVSTATPSFLTSKNAEIPTGKGDIESQARFYWVDARRFTPIQMHTDPHLRTRTHQNVSTAVKWQRVPRPHE